MATPLEVFDAWSDALQNNDKDALSRLTGENGRVRAKSTANRSTETVIETAEGTVELPTRYSRPNGEDYVARNLGNQQDVALCRAARNERLPVLLYGSPGTGKTALLEAAYHDQPGGIYTLSGSADTERADFVGSYVQSPDGTFRWVHGPQALAMLNGGVLFVDEIALIDPKVLSVAYSAMDGRNELVITENPEIGTITAAPGFFIVGACNPDVPGARMSEALVSRFTIQAEYTSDYDLAKKLGTPAKFVNAAKNLEAKRLGGEVSWAPQMRECLAFAKVHKSFGETFALRNLVAVAPEIDRDEVASVLSRAFGTPVNALKSE